MSNYLDALLLSNIVFCCLVLKAEIRVLMIIRLLFFTPMNDHKTSLFYSNFSTDFDCCHKNVLQSVNML